RAKRPRFAPLVQPLPLSPSLFAPAAKAIAEARRPAAAPAATAATGPDWPTAAVCLLMPACAHSMQYRGPFDHAIAALLKPIAVAGWVLVPPNATTAPAPPATDLWHVAGPPATQSNPPYFH